MTHAKKTPGIGKKQLALALLVMALSLLAVGSTQVVGAASQLLLADGDDVKVGSGG